MSPTFAIGSILFIAVSIALVVAYRVYRRHINEVEAAWVSLTDNISPVRETFTPEMVADLPEIARRYFLHAIEPGTLLSTTAELDMAGYFRLGDALKHKTFEMVARQILTPSESFIWLPRFRTGLMFITGSDGLISRQGWTKFWLFSVIPIVQAAGGDIDRSARERTILEAIWVPASLLPQNGADWRQTGPDTAHITFLRNGDAMEIELRLNAVGRVLSVSALRWSDANPQRQFRLQPFGGTVEAEASFGGFTIPATVHVSNHFGTPEQFTFLSATVTQARYR